MSGGLNKVMIIGDVGRTPEMRYTPHGQAVTSFSVATSRCWTNAEGEQREETEWFHVVAWARLAETCKQLLDKGQQVYVEGRLQTRCWEGTDGKTHYRTELVAQEVIVLGGRPAAADENQTLFSDEKQPDDL